VTDIRMDNEQLQDSPNVDATPSPSFEPGDNFESIMQELTTGTVSEHSNNSQDAIFNTPEKSPEEIAAELLSPTQGTEPEPHKATSETHTVEPLWGTQFSTAAPADSLSEAIESTAVDSSDIEQTISDVVAPEVAEPAQPSHQENLFDKIDQTLSQSNAASHAMFSSIAEYKRVQDEITKLITMLHTGIQHKRQQATHIKHELAVKSHQQAAFSAVARSNESLDESAQVAACSQDADTSCDTMVHHTREIQQNLGKDLATCFVKLNQVEEETNLLKLRLQYIELLKSITHDIDSLNDLRVKAQDHKARFQSCSSFFQ